MRDTATISIIDDDESVRDATKGLLRSLGYGASAFASVEDFLQSGRIDDTSCVITDVRMPGLSGIELQNLLIAQGNRTPVIFMTANPEHAIRTVAMNAGAVGVLIKPFREQSLIDCLSTALNEG